MTLVDTSVWIEHLRSGSSAMVRLLTNGSVVTHPFIIGELACGDLRPRAKVLSDLDALPLAQMATHAEAFSMIDRHKTWGKGLGWIDVHILASASLSHVKIWTLDKALHRVASTLGLAYQP